MVRLDDAVQALGRFVISALVGTGLMPSGQRCQVDVRGIAWAHHDDTWCAEPWVRSTEAHDGLVAALQAGVLRAAACGPKHRMLTRCYVREDVPKQGGAK